MLPYGAKDLARAFRTVRINTLKAVEEIPESQFDFSPAPGARTIRQLLTHIATNDTFAWDIQGKGLTTLEGYDFFGTVARLGVDEQTPRSKADIVTMLTERGEKLATWMESLSDDFLSEQVAYPPGMQPPAKTRFEMLMSVKEHEMHHRGQLMLMQRMLGVVPHLTRQFQEVATAVAQRS